MTNPYPETVTDKASGIKGQGLQHNCWQEGYDARKEEDNDLYEACQIIERYWKSDDLEITCRLGEDPIGKVLAAIAKVEK